MIPKWAHQAITYSPIISPTRLCTDCEFLCPSDDGCRCDLGTGSSSSSLYTNMATLYTLGIQDVLINVMKRFVMHQPLRLCLAVVFLLAMLLLLLQQHPGMKRRTRGVNADCTEKGRASVLLLLLLLLFVLNGLCAGPAIGR